MRLIARIARLIGAALAVAGCDDGWRIDRVDVIRDPESFVRPMLGGGVATDLRGAPFEGMTAQTVLSHLRLPPGFSDGGRFRMAQDGDATRLVIVFNPLGPPDGYGLCGGGGPEPGPQPPSGFVALATLCSGDRAISTGRLVAQKVDGAAPEKFADAMANLLRQILRSPY